MEPRECLIGVACPRGRKRAGEVVFFGDEVSSAIAHASRLDQQHLRVLGKYVGDQHVVVDEPRQPRFHAVEVGALGESFPLLTAPRLGLDQSCRTFADVVGRGELSRWEDPCNVEIDGGTLIVDTETGEPFDLVTPQVDTNWGVSSCRIHVDDCAAPCKLAAVLDDFFASVAEADEGLGELIWVDLATRFDHDGFNVECTGAELL